MSPEGALACCRFLHDAACMLLWGTFLYLAALVPPGLSQEVARRLLGYRRATITLVMLSIVLRLPAETAAITGEWADAVRPAALWLVLCDTGLGHNWALQAVLSLFLLPGLRRCAQPWSIMAGAGALLIGSALTGHAVMHEGWLGVFHRGNHVAHLLAGGAWLGALVPLLPILATLPDAVMREEAALALRRFSGAGHATVAIVILTGIINSLLILGHWLFDPASPYQGLLVVKMGLVALMTALAVGNRYVLVPMRPGHNRQALRLLRLGTWVEIGLGVAAIACVSLFGLWEPG